MKTLALHAVLLTSLFLLACHVSIPKQSIEMARAESAPRELDDWRRTADGWEKISSWQTTPVESRPPAEWCVQLSKVHPVTWSTLQCLIATGALLALPARVQKAAA